VEELSLALTTRRRTRHLGAALAGALGVGDIVWLEGDLGAGKTFFARGLLRALGVPEAVPVTSPTFALVHEHEGRSPIVHLDLYRLGAAGELLELGLDELLATAIVVVEWGARFREAIGRRGIEIELAMPAEGPGRVATLRAFDARGRAALESVAADPRVRAMRA
jgi:tRNA threonylcarbamoyladenosine biosynthesis protein TsaE